MSSQSVAYSPEELASFRTVFEEAIDSCSPMMLTTSNRLQVAQNIFARAATGERDQSELQLAALANVSERSRYGDGVPRPMCENGDDSGPIAM
jgi:hypothetical protein